MTYITLIKQALQALSPSILEVVDESHQHQGHGGYRGDDAGTHFSITVVSEHFTNLSNIARHRVIYRLLENELKTHIHAIAIKAMTPQEANLALQGTHPVTDKEWG